MTTTIEILKAARDLIAKPENWTHGAYARDIQGVAVPLSDDEATCFCAAGAIFRAGSFPEYEPIPRHICEKFGFAYEATLAQFNDTHTHSEVLELFSKAISSAEEKQGAAA
jgi:hypothetical protein